MEAVRCPGLFTLPEPFVVSAIQQHGGASLFAPNQGGIHARTLFGCAVSDVISRYEEERVRGGVEEFYVIDRHEIGLDAGYRWKEAWQREGRSRDPEVKSAAGRHCLFPNRRHRCPASLRAADCRLDGVECE